MASSDAEAADVIKADNTTALNASGSWVGGVVPGAADRAIWDATVTSANTVGLGGNTTWGGVWVQNPAGAVTIQDAFTLSAGAVTVDSAASLVFNNSTSTLNATSLNGAGTLTISKGVSTTFLTGMTAANSLNLTGSLLLRGGNASTSAGTMQSSWFAMGGSGVSQAAGTAFALDTGASANNAKDIIFADAWGGKTVTMSSLAGFGSIRRDSGLTNNVTLRVDQTTTTTFNGLILSHTSGNNSAIRSIDFVKAGTGTLTLAGLVGKQTASAGSVNSPVNIEVTGGTLVLTANNTTTGTLTVRNGSLLRMENGSAGTSFTGGNSSMTGNYTIDAGGEIQAYRNGSAAFGTGTIVMNGGSLFTTSGNWTWTNAITLNNATSSTIGNKATGGAPRWMKLQGEIGGSGNVTLSDAAGTVTSGDTGIILTGENTMSGTVTVDTFVRVGGVPGDSTSLVAGTGGSLGTAAVTVNSGKRLTFSRSDTHTVSNTISGAGGVYVGSTGITGSDTQDLTLSGSNTYTGGTELLQGILRVAALSGIGSTTGGNTGYLAVKNGSTFAYTGSGSESTTRNLFLDSGASRIDVTEATGSLTWNDSSAKNGAFTKGGAGALAIGGAFSGAASVTVLDGSLSLGGASTYSGATTVSGGTLLVNGSLANTSGVSVASGAVLGGTGSMAAAISGAGLVSPGNSPGITTATAVDPTGGLGFAFEFTATGSPDYANASASINDVLRLTDGTTPFTSSLSGGNAIDVYFDVTTLGGGDTFKGGFYTDLQSDFLTTVENGTYAYWVKGDGTGTDRTFNGQGYFSLANFDSGLSVTLSTVAETANFAGGTANGQVTQFVVVPEPATIALVAVAFGMVVAMRRRFG